MHSFEVPTIDLSPKLRIAYSTIRFGSLIVRNVPNQKKSNVLEEKKQSLEQKIQNSKIDPVEDELIKSYNRFFNRWGKTYPIEYQLKTVRKGGRFPLVSVLVDSMFLVELKNQILTSGHDLDLIQGHLIFDVTEGGERYLKLNGKEQELKKDDIILRDAEGILSSALYGPARRTAINSETKNALYLAWCPFGMNEEIITEHLNQILGNLSSIFDSISTKVNIYE